MKTSIVLPVFNEEKRIIEVLKDISKTKFPIVVVDDGSTDKSVKIIKDLKLKNLVLLEHKINLGKGAAIKTGCDYVFKKDTDNVILMDSDGQHSVADLPRFIEKIKKGYDVVLGSRNLGMGVPLDRYMGNKIASVLVAFLFGIYASDLLCGFRAITKNAYKKIELESSGYGVEIETVIKVKKFDLKYCEVPVETIYYDSFKGVSILDAFEILGNIFRWRFKL